METPPETTPNSLKEMLPESNREAVELLYVLEVGLRELIIETLAVAGGPKWFKTQLPPDITEKYVRGRKTQFAASWSTHIEHHPIYYIDFPDLAKVLDKNWRNIFQDLLGNKDVFLGSLKALEPIRNTVAHNRKLSASDCDIVRGILTIFEAGIGKSRLMAFVKNCSAAPTISQLLADLREEVTSATEAMSDLRSPVELKVWPSIQNAWWFDSSFLTNSNHAARLDLAKIQLTDLRSKISKVEQQIESLSNLQSDETNPSIEYATEDVISFFELFAQFASLPRSRGIGHKIESWMSSQEVAGKSKLAIDALNSLLRHNHE